MELLRGERKPMLREQLIERLMAWKQSSPRNLAASKQAGKLLGRDYRALGMWGDAEEVFGRVLEACAGASDLPGVAEFTIWLSNLSFHKGEYHQALRYAARGIALRRRTQGPQPAADSAAYYLGRPLLVLDRLPQQRRAIEQAIRVHANSPAHLPATRLPWLNTYLGENLRESGLGAEASALLEKQVQVFRMLGHKSGLAFALLQWGRTTIACGQATEAFERLRESLELFRNLQREGFVCDCLVALARAKVLVHDHDGALVDVDQALELAYRGPIRTEGLADTLHLNDALLCSAKVRALTGQKERAAADLRKAYFLATRHHRELLLRHLREHAARACGCQSTPEPSRR